MLFRKVVRPLLCTLLLHVCNSVELNSIQISCLVVVLPNSLSFHHQTTSKNTTDWPGEENASVGVMNIGDAFGKEYIMNW